MRTSSEWSPKTQEQRDDLSQDKKRKRLPPQKDISATTNLDISSDRQQSIQNLFTARNKPSAQDQGSFKVAGSEPPSKRQRTDHPVSLQSRCGPTIESNAMYSFTSKQPTSPVIDLTKSSPTNGQRRRISGGNLVQNGLMAQKGPKKLVVKNLKKQSDWNSEDYFTKIWAQLDEALTKVFAGSHAQLSLEDLYRCVENLSRQGKASSVNSRLNERIVKHLKGDILPSLQSKAQDDVPTLKSVLADWSTWKAQVVCTSFSLTLPAITYISADRLAMHLLLHGSSLSFVKFKNELERCLRLILPQYHIRGSGSDKKGGEWCM